MNLYDNNPVPEYEPEVKFAANAIGWALEQVCQLTLHPSASLAAARNLYDQGLLKPVSPPRTTEALTDETDPRTAFCDELEAPGTPLCDCEADSEENPATSPRTGERMDHHCECRAVLASQVLRKGRKTLHGKLCHCEDRS